MSSTETDPAALPLDALRALRTKLQQDDDVVSYVRRLTQARIDLVRAELRLRREGPDGGSGERITQELPVILGSHLTGGPARPPRPVEDFSDHPLAAELEELTQEMGGDDVISMADDELLAFAVALQAFEQLRSQERKQLFGRIDALSAELVRRYRDGEADVDGLLADG